MRIRFCKVDAFATVGDDSPDLGPEDRAHLRQITHPERRTQSIAARRALRMALDAEFGSESRWGVHYSEMQKPYLRNEAPSAAHTRDCPHLSLAHTDGLAVAILSPSPCGIDIESLARPRIARPWARLASAGERAQCAHLPAQLRQRYMITSWTIKEAWAKLWGDGLAKRAREIHIAIDEDGTWSAHTRTPANVFVAERDGNIVGVVY